MSEVQLLSHQRRAVESFNGYSYLAWETGTGKTLAALKIAENFKNVLIMCPASVKTVWKNEMEKWGIKLRNVEIVSYDYFRMHTDEILKKAFWNFVIFDEAHKLKNVKAKITKLVMKIFNKTYKVMLSGTPFEKPEDYYAQLRILRPDHPFNQISFRQYKNTFFIIDDRFNYIIDFIPGLKDKFLEKFVLKYVDFVKRADVVELPSLVEVPRLFNSNNYLISDLEIDEEELHHLLDEDELDEYSRKLLKIFMHKYKRSALLKDKIDYVCDFIEDNKQTVVFSYFLEPLKHIVKKLGRDRVYFITGENKRDLELALKRADKPLLATYCISEGINLTYYKNIIFLCLPLAWRTFEQAISRVWRFGQKDKVYLQILINKNEIDARILEILKKKKNVLEELKLKAKQKIKPEQLINQLNG
jgi:SWI/SNF-related matrix-associated actin-dependent regulator 1 of chromatin subfamily A